MIGDKEKYLRRWLSSLVSFSRGQFGGCSTFVPGAVMLLNRPFLGHHRCLPAVETGEGELERGGRCGTTFYWGKTRVPPGERERERWKVALLVSIDVLFLRHLIGESSPHKNRSAYCTILFLSSWHDQFSSFIAFLLVYCCTRLHCRTSNFCILHGGERFWWGFFPLRSSHLLPFGFLFQPPVPPIEQKKSSTFLFSLPFLPFTATLKRERERERRKEPFQLL